MAQQQKESRETSEVTKSERKPPQSAERVPARTGRGLGVFEDIDRLFEEFMQSRWPASMGWQMPTLRSLGAEALGMRTPSVDICENDDELIVRAEVPGVSRDNLDVSIVDRTLTIKGSTRDEQKEEREDYYRREIRSGEFSRSVLLPSEVDPNKAQASMKDGVLELRLPKASGAKRRKIEVS